MSKKRTSPKVVAKKKALPPLTANEQQILSFVSNSVAFDNYGDCCSVEDMAKQFKRTPGRFLVTLKKMADMGYLSIKGEALPWVYPTIAALLHQDPQLSEAKAKKILKKIER